MSFRMFQKIQLKKQSETLNLKKVCKMSFLKKQKEESANRWK